MDKSGVAREKKAHINDKEIVLGRNIFHLLL